MLSRRSHCRRRLDPAPAHTTRRTTMNNDALKTLVAQGLAAMKNGGKVAAQVTDEIRNDARHPDLSRNAGRPTRPHK
ncbi:hypothetical protein Mpop_3798 [Methylorubrum populi BJ001]|uniref:Uncharacterized protein n=2 Tax=Methylobacteriaceae TaxID=119045 RepID=B1Z9G8_METPB|nr:hypothetical protein Mpop_3798 [Methylorubrum populi BJ001]